MTLEEVQEVLTLEQRHEMYDMDPDSLRGLFHTGPADEAGPHLFGSLIPLEG